MMTGKEYLKEHIGETNIPEEHYENEIGEIMDWYADDYHQEKVKNLSLSDVSQQREPFINFAKEVIEYFEQHDIGDEDIYNKAKKLINGG